MSWRTSFRITGMGCLLVALGACNGASDRIPRPDSLEGVEPKVVAFIENGIAVVEEDPTQAFPRAGLGMIYQAHEMLEPARIAYRQALEIEPDNARWLFHLAHVEWALGDGDAAVAAIDRSIDLEPRYAPSYRRRAGWSLRHGDPDAAATDYRKAIDLMPQDQAAYRGLAHALIAQDKKDQATTLLSQRGIELGEAPPQADDDRWTREDIYRFKLDFAAYVKYVEALAMVGEQERAITEFEALLQSRPDDPYLMLQLGRNYISGGRREEGVATLERGLELHPQDVALLGEVATAYRAEQPDRALELLDRVIELRPTDGLAHARRGAILQEQERYPEAAASYRQALNYRPRDTRVMLLFGDCLVRLGQDETAVQVYRQALTIDENNAELLARLGVTLHRLGSFREASEALAKALRIEPDHPDWVELLEEWRRAGQV